VAQILQGSIRRDHAVDEQQRDRWLGVPVPVLGEPAPLVGETIEADVSERADGRAHWCDEPSELMSGKATKIGQSKLSDLGQMIGDDGCQHAGDQPRNGDGDGHTKSDHFGEGVRPQRKRRALQCEGKVRRHRTDHKGQTIHSVRPPTNDRKDWGLMGKERDGHPITVEDPWGCWVAVAKPITQPSRHHHMAMHFAELETTIQSVCDDVEVPGNYVEATWPPPTERLAVDRDRSDRIVLGVIAAVLHYVALLVSSVMMVVAIKVYEGSVRHRLTGGSWVLNVFFGYSVGLLVWSIPLTYLLKRKRRLQRRRVLIALIGQLAVGGGALSLVVWFSQRTGEPSVSSMLFLVIAMSPGVTAFWASRRPPFVAAAQLKPVGPADR
jgi:hypothetical protein